MNPLPRVAALALVLCLLGEAQIRGATQPRAIRVYRVGSSSFGPELLTDAKRIVDATGSFTLDWDAKKDSASYTRLDQFVTQPGLYEEWCGRYLPLIEAGKYDYVVFQTISWLELTPAQQTRLLTEILPDLFAKIRKTGAQVILYDKFLPTDYRDEKDPRAREWVARYPDGERFNYLLHVLAAKRGGVEKITFGGPAVRELWAKDPFATMKYLYNDPGHPGTLSHYLSACILSYLMTGIDPVGNTVRKVPMSAWQTQAFREEPLKGGQAFHDMYKDRVRDGEFEMTDAEATAVQEAAMRHHRRCSAGMNEALTNAAAFARVEAEIAAIQADMCKPEKYGLSPKSVEKILKSHAEAGEPGGLSPAAIEKARSRCTSLYDFGKLCQRALPPDLRAATVKDCGRYWDENNGKLRDDVLYEALIYDARAGIEGNREEVARMKKTVATLWGIIALPGSRMIWERLPEDKRAAFLATVDQPGKAYAPAFAAHCEKLRGEPTRLFAAWESYLAVWTDPNLLDRLKASQFARDVFLEADKEFARRNAGK